MNVVPKGHGIYAIYCNYFSPALVRAAKAVPGMSWDSAARQWVGYADAVAATAARLRAEGLRLDTSELHDADSWRSARSPFLFSTKNLREYQVTGVRFLIARSPEGALLADGMRLGKSCQALIAARAFKQKTLIICPSHVVGVWGREPSAPEGPGEIAKWWPDAWLSDASRGEGEAATPGVVSLEGVRPDAAEETERLRNAICIVVSYDIVYAWVEILKEWGLATLIVDECHALQGRDSRRSSAVRDLAQQARRRMFLSGTPMTSRPRDLHNALDTLTPGRFGYFFTHQKPGKPPSGSFSRLYCAAHEKTVGKGPEAKTVWDFNGASNLSEVETEWIKTPEETLHARLSYLMLRRVKSEVDTQLPPKTRQIINVKIPARMMVTPTGAMLQDRGALRHALDLSADGKLKSVVDLVHSHVEEGEKVICFCYRRLFAESVSRELSKKKIETTYVHGGLTQAARDKRIQHMRTHAGPCVLCATIDTTSTGIDLSFSSVAVFGELTWEPHELAQAEERVYKFGAGVSPLVQYVIARGTGDELIVRAVISKLDDFEKAIGRTGDRMKEDLDTGLRGEAALRRLAGALAEMQLAAAPAKRKRARG